MDSKAMMLRAREEGTALPAFNIAYLPMTKPIVEAVVDENSLALLEVARIDWEKFSARSLEAAAEEFGKWANLDYVRLHMDHVPVIDEDGEYVDYLPIIRRAIESGYHSVMIDASRKPLDENVRITRRISEVAHERNIPCEAELGAVLGHEAGPMPPYEELYRTGKGFTDLEDAEIFARESGCDWLSVAFGSVHGAVAEGKRDEKKIEARLNLDHLASLADVTGLPLVLHGGSGIREEHLRESFVRGISKLNVGTDIRHVYETTLSKTGSESEAQEAVYLRTRLLIRETYRLTNMKEKLGF